jgi:hypothetical protein
MACHTARYASIAAASVVAMGIVGPAAAAPATMATPGPVTEVCAPAQSTDGALILAGNEVRPLPEVQDAQQTVPARNNNFGQIAGLYLAQDGEYRGYLMTRDAAGCRVEVIEPENAVFTAVTGINDSGRVVGSYQLANDPILHGFTWYRGTFTPVAVPDGSSPPNVFHTSPYEINNGGVIVGDYIDARGVQHGFIYRNGQYETYNARGATDAPNVTGTRVLGINDQGDMVGSYGADATDRVIRPWAMVDGTFIDLVPPGLGIGEASGIENQGLIVIKVRDTRPKLISFAFDGSNYTPLEPRLPNRCDLAAVSINDLGEVLVPPIRTVEGTTCPGT